MQFFTTEPEHIKVRLSGLPFNSGWSLMTLLQAILATEFSSFEKGGTHDFVRIPTTDTIAYRREHA